MRWPVVIRALNKWLSPGWLQEKTQTERKLQQVKTELAAIENVLRELHKTEVRSEAVKGRAGKGRIGQGTEGKGREGKGREG